VLLVITGGLMEFDGAAKIARVLVSLPLLVLFSWLFVKYVLLPLLEKFDAFHEYIFLVAIAWCLGLAELSELAGLSLEIGAFVAGVTIATSPIALYIADHLKPLRDFFLVLFFFSIGAGFHMDLLAEVIVPAAVIATVILGLKPVTFKFMLRRMSETSALGWETGFRLGQISEFSLLIAFVATAQNLISQEASHLIQATAILTFLASSYLVVFRYPTPIAVDDRLRRD
jgi:Kef-type K+ transport system membrane component KefB